MHYFMSNYNEIMLTNVALMLSVVCCCPCSLLSNSKNKSQMKSPDISIVSSFTFGQMNTSAFCFFLNAISDCVQIFKYTKSRYSSNILWTPTQALHPKDSAIWTWSYVFWVCVATTVMLKITLQFYTFSVLYVNNLCLFLFTCRKSEHLYINWSEVTIPFGLLSWKSTFWAWGERIYESWWSIICCPKIR